MAASEAPRPVPELKAPFCFISEFVTTAGSFRVESWRSWSPHGVDRLYSLIRAGYYNNTRFHRVVSGWVLALRLEPMTFGLFSFVC
eukprot:1352219-Prymnesium_polylepis.1